ncbi:MAG: hypothetical protein ACK4PN_08495 [Allorhizobium sp.]
MTAFKRPPISDEELEQWASTRADDAGHLARELIAVRPTSPARPPNLRDIVSAFEAAYPELYYHIAKGKVCAGEPLYGAIITTMGATEIGHGESDISADDAFRIAIENAGLTKLQIPPPELTAAKP